MGKSAKKARRPNMRATCSYPARETTANQRKPAETVHSDGSSRSGDRSTEPRENETNLTELSSGQCAGAEPAESFPGLLSVTEARPQAEAATPKPAEEEARSTGRCGCDESDRDDPSDQEPLDFEAQCAEAEASFEKTISKNQFWRWSRKHQNWFHGSSPEEAKIWYPKEWLASADAHDGAFRMS